MPLPQASPAGFVDRLDTNQNTTLDLNLTNQIGQRPSGVYIDHQKQGAQNFNNMNNITNIKEGITQGNTDESNFWDALAQDELFNKK